MYHEQKTANNTSMLTYPSSRRGTSFGNIFRKVVEFVYIQTGNVLAYQHILRMTHTHLYGKSLLQTLVRFTYKGTYLHTCLQRYKHTQTPCLTEGPTAKLIINHYLSISALVQDRRPPHIQAIASCVYCMSHLPNRNCICVGVKRTGPRVCLH